MTPMLLLASSYSHTSNLSLVKQEYWQMYRKIRLELDFFRSLVHIVSMRFKQR